MTDPFAPADAPSRPVWSIPEGGLERAPAWARPWAESLGFKGQTGRVLPLPGADGTIAGLLLGVGKGEEPFVHGALAREAPEGVWRLEGLAGGGEATRAALAFALGSYAFTRYKSEPPALKARLVAPAGAVMSEVRRQAEAVTLVRDLVNTPAEDMGPAELADAALDLAAHHGATARAIVGDDLLTENWPLVHAVGRAAARAPRVVDFTWGDPDHPKVTLVGKGVCFDTGGLDIKPSSAMALMKKDMGGAANILGLAGMIMDAGLRVRLRVIIPMVENAISGNAFRTSDVFASRKGLTVEIGNTDAEGRLILADALAEADAEAPAMLIDLATLTGAARVALGPELPPVYTDDETLAAELAEASAAEADPLWRLPLWPGYAKGLDSRVADMKSTADGAFAGSVIAALFLKRFVTRTRTWLHGDVYAWNPEARPGRPQGGEAQTIRALFRVLTQRYAP